MPWRENFVANESTLACVGGERRRYKSLRYCNNVVAVTIFNAYCLSTAFK
jgi:hypothetical protein